MAYDITGAFEEIEMALITSMRNNMRRHINEEFEEGMNWSQWQAEVLSGLSQYRAENQEVLQGYMGRINQAIDSAIREAYATGESEQEIEILKAIKRGYQPPKEGDKTDLQGRFFRINENKLNALVNATVNDMERAETSMFRMIDDIYRQIPFKAQMFYNTGAGSLWQCVDMATRDFLSSGINCVQYRNGARVNIASYVEMALRTANKMANLMGQAQAREKWGIHTVKVNARGIACPMCLQWLDKVYIDNVYGGGTAKESETTGYPLLSVAVEGGLYHPNCKDSCSTYYEGINREPREITDTEKDEILRRYNLEQKQRYYERNYRRNMRLGNGCIWQENANIYFGRAREYKNRLIELCENNPDVLRLDKQRLSLRGILSVDNAGRIEVPPKYKDKLNVIHTEAYNNLINRLNRNNVDFLKVKKLRNKLSIDKIIERLAGGDMTSGSCASVGLAYVGNRNGLDVLDFRGGASQQFFSSRFNLDELTRILPEDSVMTSVARSYITSGNRLLQQVEQGREYYFVCGRHASIVRRNEDNVLQYLELQSSTRSGWTDFNANPRHTLSTRFGCRNTTGRDVTGFMVDVESFQDNEEFMEILGYINTNASEQRRGASGYAK
jgi:hypothetical protein